MGHLSMATVTLALFSAILLAASTALSHEMPAGRKFLTGTQLAATQHSHAIRGEMTRRGAPHLTTFERVTRAAKASRIRSAHIRDRVLKTTAEPDIRSPVSVVPGEYAMVLELGTPPQKFTVIADTGSDLIWIQGRACTKCLKTPSLGYDPTASTTYSALACSSSMCQNVGQQASCSASASADCKYTYTYGDSSNTQGSFGTETITLAGTDGSIVPIANFAFGYGLSNEADFQDVDGIMGLGQGPISFPSQLGTQYGKVFSYCLQSFSDGPNKTSPIIFGTSSVPQGNVQYTSLQQPSIPQESTFWFIDLGGVSVNGQRTGENKTHKSPVLASNVPTIIDSGTTITEIDLASYQALKASLDQVVTYTKVDGKKFEFDLCYDTSKVPSPTFPSVTFHFQGADWVAPWQNVFIPVDETGTMCLAVIASDPSQDLNIIGNILQQNFRVIYDQVNSRLGWVAADCDSL